MSVGIKGHGQTRIGRISGEKSTEPAFIRVQIPYLCPVCLIEQRVASLLGGHQ